MKSIVVIITVFSLLSCQSNNKNSESVVENFNIEKNMETQKDFSEIEKLSLKEAIQKYGKPLTQESFILEDIAVTEFRIKLYNLFTKEQLKESIPLKEITWKAKQDSLITVWYKEDTSNWKPIDVFQYSKDEEF